jgi:hypothetical protein
MPLIPSAQHGAPQPLLHTALKLEAAPLCVCVLANLFLGPGLPPCFRVLVWFIHNIKFIRIGEQEEGQGGGERGEVAEQGVTNRSENNGVSKDKDKDDTSHKTPNTRLSTHILAVTEHRRVDTEILAQTHTNQTKRRA